MNSRGSQQEVAATSGDGTEMRADEGGDLETENSIGASDHEERAAPIPSRIKSDDEVVVVAAAGGSHPNDGDAGETKNESISDPIADAGSANLSESHGSISDIPFDLSPLNAPAMAPITAADANDFAQVSNTSPRTSIERIPILGLPQESNPVITSHNASTVQESTSNGASESFNGRYIIKKDGSDLEYSTDEFVGMPNSETNIKKVTVLMGRGQEIEEDMPILAPSNSQQQFPDLVQYNTQRQPSPLTVASVQPSLVSSDPHRPMAMNNPLPTQSIVTHNQHYSHQQSVQNHGTSQLPLHLQQSLQNHGTSQLPQHLHHQNPLPLPSTQPTHLNNSDNSFNSILNSPQTKDAIVETSPQERYLRFSEKLGSGAYKDVYRAYDTIEGIEVAWNVVNLSGVPKAERQYIVNEVRLLEKLNHSNIISFHGSWVNRELEQVIFVTEILSSGTLKAFINKVQVIRWKIAKRWAIQILKGLEYLHSQNPPIIHRDLKCDNVFINGTSGDLRIGDLGLSTVMSNKGKLSVLGTPEFMAPELYDEAYDQTIDIYAFGMCMLEIFTKELPYRECSNPAQIYKKVTHGREPESLNRLRNPDAREFIRLCLGRSDGSGGFTRPTAIELLSHSFLAKKSDDDSEVEVDPRFMERPIPEMVPDPSSVGRRNSNDSPAIENEINTRMNHPPSPTSNTEIFYGDNPYYSDDSAKQKSSREEVPFFKPNTGDNTVILSHVNERYQIISDTNNVGRDNDSTHQQHAHQQQSHQQAPEEQDLYQDLNAISSQGGAPTIDDSNGTSNGASESFNGRYIIKKDGSDLECSTDEFVGMPNSETNIKKVTVLMGRGQEIEEDMPILAPSNSQQTLPISDEADHNIDRKGSGGLSSLGESFPGSQQYLIAGNIVEDKNLDPPFANDKITIAMSLSVEPYQVQFEFHLIEDDPVQVAREMVTDLSVTEYAVLQVSENISALARSARMKQQSSTLYQQKRHDDVLLPLLASGGNSTSSMVTSGHAIPNNLDDTTMDKHNGTMAAQTHLQLSLHSIELSDTEPQVSTVAAGESDDDDTSCSSEYIQLKKEYEIRVKRTKKAYDTRMENFHRSREEKEAQHQITLQKHEKERANLEKRVKQAEEEQNQRLLVLQEEWEKKCARAKKSKIKSPQNSKLPPLPPSGEDKDSKSVVTGFEKNRMSANNLALLNPVPVDKNSASASSGSSIPSMDGSCSDKSR